MILVLEQSEAYRIAKITECMDLLAGFDLLDTEVQYKELFAHVTDSLGNYPKPQLKGSTKEPTNEVLGAYLCISNVRNALKLAKLGVVTYQTGYGIASLNAELALSLLLD